MSEEATTDQQVEHTEEQLDLSSNQAGEPDSGVEEGEQEEATGADDSAADSESDSVELIGQDRFDALKNNPAALRKELNRAATKKFQQLAKQREELEPYADLIKGLDEDPRGTVEALARQLGINLGGPPARVEQQVVEMSDAVRDAVRESLGPEYEDIADRLAPAMRKVAEMVAAETAKPLVHEQNRIIQEAAMRESVSIIGEFEKANPGWRKHEPAMVELSKKLTPQPGMSEREYMDILYTVVTRDTSEGDRTKRIVERINKSTRNDSGGNRVPSREVVTRPTALPTFEEAAAAARRGERFE